MKVLFLDIDGVLNTDGGERQIEPHLVERLNKIMPHIDSLVISDMSKLNGNVRKRIRERDGGCVECNATEDLTVHHIIPLSDGGTHHESNLVTLCLDCHKELHGV